MNPHNKCLKLASVLDTFAEKLRDPNIGVDLWAKNEASMRTLVTQLLLILNSAAELNKPNTLEQLEDEWPDIINWE